MESIIDEKEIKSNSERKEGRFPENYSMFVCALIRIKGSLAGKEFLISIDLNQENNYVSTKCSNKLVIPESSITETSSFRKNEKQYDIGNLHLSIGDYSLVSQFTVKTLFCNDSDIILGSLWMESLGSFVLNTKKKFLTLSYKKKK